MGHGHGGHAAAFDDDRQVRRLEAEARLASALHEEVAGRCAEVLARDGVTAGRVLDLGSGPGVATALLARRFPEARVVAVDGSPRMLARAGALAAQDGVADRVETRQLDLDGDLEALGRADLVWMAMVLHHAADAPALLRRVGRLLAPRGLLCLLEHAEPTQVRLGSDLGRPGLWDRLDAAWATRPPHRPDLPAALTDAGLAVLGTWTARTTATAPADEATSAFVDAHLAGTARALDGLADPGDLEALRHGTPGDAPAVVAQSRTVLLARAAVAQDG